MAASDDDMIKAMAGYGIAYTDAGTPSFITADRSNATQDQLEALQRQVDKMQVQQMTFEHLIREQPAASFFYPTCESWETEPGDRVTLWLD